jgi:hypothetical protein
MSQRHPQFLIPVVSIQYGVINPVILPLCLGYFLTCYIAWKYSIIYFYERSQVRTSKTIII